MDSSNPVIVGVTCKVGGLLRPLPHRHLWFCTSPLVPKNTPMMSVLRMNYSHMKEKQIHIYYYYIYIHHLDSFGILKSSRRKGGQVLDHSPSPVFLWTDSMSYVLWIWSICPCRAHLVTESFMVKSTSQLDIDLLSGSHVVRIDWSKGFRGFNSIVLYTEGSRKRKDESKWQKDFTQTTKARDGYSCPRLDGWVSMIAAVTTHDQLHCLLHSRSRKTPPWMFWWWPVGMVWGAKGLYDRCVCVCVSENSSL